MQFATTIASPSARTFTPTAATWLKLSVIYLIAGVSIGIAMGATQNFAMRPVHAHLNLLGWTTVALTGLIYAVFPVAGASRLARIHFWLHNTSVPVMMSALALMLLGHMQAVPFLVASEFVAAAGIIVFACNLFRNVKLADSRLPL